MTRPHLNAVHRNANSEPLPRDDLGTNNFPQESAAAQAYAHNIVQPYKLDENCHDDHIVGNCQGIVVAVVEFGVASDLKHVLQGEFDPIGFAALRRIGATPNPSANPEPRIKGHSLTEACDIFNGKDGD